VTIEELLKLAAQPGLMGLLAVALYFFWKEVRGVKTAIHNGNNAVQEILVKALTGELKSYDQWKAKHREAHE
jgi:hypothetical protein